MLVSQNIKISSKVFNHSNNINIFYFWPLEITVPSGQLPNITSLSDLTKSMSTKIGNYQVDLNSLYLVDGKFYFVLKRTDPHQQQIPPE